MGLCPNEFAKRVYEVSSDLMDAVCIRYDAINTECDTGLSNNLGRKLQRTSPTQHGCRAWPHRGRGQIMLVHYASNLDNCSTG